MEEELESTWQQPLKYILAIALILLIILMIVPYYAVKLDPEPTNIPLIAEVLPQDIQYSNYSITLNQLNQFVIPSDPTIKFVANKIATTACDGNIICQSKALFYFVRDNIEYVADPINIEYIEHPTTVLLSGGADCESGSILLASLQEAIGVDSQLVIISGHVYVRIKLDEALSKYKKDNYIYLDWTCSNCEYGEIPLQNINKQARILEVP